MRHLPQLPLENKSMPIASPPKMKMWGQEELLRCWVGQRNHKSDFGETNPILPQAQETKTHLSAMTVYFWKQPETADLKSRLRWTASAFTSAAFKRTTRRGKRELERVQQARSFPSDHTPGKRSGITSPACVDNGFETDRSSWLRGQRLQP